MKSRLTLLDSVIIVLGAMTLSIVLLWAAGEILHAGIFVDPPDYIRSIANNIFVVITSGSVGSLLLIILRKQLSQNRPTPPYILWIVGTAVFFIIVTVLLARQLVDLTERKDVTVDFERVTSEDDQGLDVTVSGPITGRHDRSSLRAVYTPAELGTTMEFFREGEAIGEMKLYKTIEIIGACVQPDEGKLNLILHAWLGGAGIPGSILAAGYDEPTHRVVVDQIHDVFDYNGDVKAIPQGLRCRAGERPWVTNAKENQRQTFVPCACAFRRLASVDRLASEFYSLALVERDITFDSLPDPFYRRRAVSLTDSVLLVDSTEVTKFLNYVSRIKRDSPFEIERLSSSRFEVLLIVYNRDVYGSWGLLLERPLLNEDWRLIHEATVSSKAFHRVSALEFVSPTQLKAHMCVDDCHWWGFQADVIIDLPTLTVRLIGDIPPTRKS